MAVDGLRPGRHEPLVGLGGHVVVVTVETAAGDVVPLGEFMEFGEVTIADQM